MLDHVGIQCADLARSAAFYDAVLAPLGASRLMDFGVARHVADGFDVVAVRVADERPVVVLVVLGPDPGLVEHLRPVGHRGVEELTHDVSRRRRERQV